MRIFILFSSFQAKSGGTCTLLRGWLHGGNPSKVKDGLNRMPLRKSGPLLCPVTAVYLAHVPFPITAGEDTQRGMQVVLAPSAVLVSVTKCFLSQQWCLGNAPLHRAVPSLPSSSPTWDLAFTTVTASQAAGEGTVSAIKPGSGLAPCSQPWFPPGNAVVPRAGSIPCLW